MVDLVGALRIEMAEGVVGDRGEMDDRIEASEVLYLNVPDVLSLAGTPSGSGPSEQPSNRNESSPAT